MTMTDTQVLMWGTKSFDALGLCGQVQPRTQLGVTGSGEDSSATQRSPRLTGKAWGGGWEVLRKSHREQVWERLGAGFLTERA